MRSPLLNDVCWKILLADFSADKISLILSSTCLCNFSKCSATFLLATRLNEIPVHLISFFWKETTPYDIIFHEA